MSTHIPKHVEVKHNLSEYVLSYHVGIGAWTQSSGLAASVLLIVDLTWGYFLCLFVVDYPCSDKELQDELW